MLGREQGENLLLPSYERITDIEFLSDTTLNTLLAFVKVITPITFEDLQQNSHY